MSVILKIISSILVAVILCLALKKENADMAMLLSLLMIAMTIITGLKFVNPILDFFQKLEQIGSLEPKLLKTLLKAVGLSILSEITILICEDSGQKAMGKALQTVVSVVILWMSIPLFEKLLELLNEILGAI